MCFCLIFTTPVFCCCQGETFFTSCHVTRRRKFWLCTLRAPLPNWGLTRPPNMPKVSPVAHHGRWWTASALKTLQPVLCHLSRRPLLELRRFGWELLCWRGGDVAASSAAGASVAAARDARGKRKQSTLVSKKNCKSSAFFVLAKLQGQKNKQLLDDK